MRYIILQLKGNVNYSACLLFAGRFSLFRQPMSTNLMGVFTERAVFLFVAVKRKQIDSRLLLGMFSSMPPMTNTDTIYQFAQLCIVAN